MEKKSLNLLQLTFASTSAIVGSGWLLGVYLSATYAGPASIFAWFISGFAVMLIALVYSELGGMLPAAGAIAKYPKYTHGAFLGFITSWMLIIAGAGVSTVETEATVQYLNSRVPHLFIGHSLTHEGMVLAVFILLVFFLLNLFGVKIFAGINAFLTWFKLLIPVLTIAALLYCAVKSGAARNLAFYNPLPYGYGGFMKSISLGGVIFSYLGFRQAIELSGEARNPGRDVPLATILSILIAIVIYTLLALSFVLAVPLVKNNAWKSLAYPSPYVDLFGIYGLPALAGLIIIGAIISPFATGLVYLGTTSRVTYAMARMKFLPKSFCSRLNKYGIAYPALVFTFCLSALYLLPFPSWKSLVGIITSGIVFTYIMGPVGLMTFRKLDPDRKRPFFLPFAKIIALLAFIVGTLIIYWAGFTVLWKLGLGILAGVLLFVFLNFGKGGKKLGRTMKSGLWFLCYAAAILAAAFLGNRNSSGGGIIRPPYDLLVVISVAVLFYFVAINASIKKAEMKMIIEEEFSGERI